MKSLIKSFDPDKAFADPKNQDFIRSFDLRILGPKPISQDHKTAISQLKELLDLKSNTQSVTTSVASRSGSLLLPEGIRNPEGWDYIHRDYLSEKDILLINAALRLLEENKSPAIPILNRLISEFSGPLKPEIQKIRDFMFGED